MKRHSISLFFMEGQIKTTTHLLEWLKLKTKSWQPTAGENAKKLDQSYIAGRNLK